MRNNLLLLMVVLGAGCATAPSTQRAVVLPAAVVLRVLPTETTRVVADVPSLIETGAAGTVKTTGVEAGLFAVNDGGELLSPRPIFQQAVRSIPTPEQVNIDGVARSVVAVSLDTGLVPTDTKLYRVGVRYHGLFTPRPTTSFEATDTVTQGNWVGTYGADGALLVGATTLDTSVGAPSAAAVWTWESPTSDTRALVVGTTRVASCWFSSSSFSVAINLPDVRRVSIYVVDWDHLQRVARFDLLDASGAVLDSRTVAGYTEGVWLSWVAQGQIQLRAANVAGANVVVSGIFLDKVAGSQSALIGGATVSNWTLASESLLRSSDATYELVPTARPIGGPLQGAPAAATTGWVR